MRCALYDVFRKNIGLLLVLCGVFAAVKIFTFQSLEVPKGNHEYMEDWLSRCRGKNGEELEAVVSEIRREYLTGSVGDQGRADDYAAFNTAYDSLSRINSLIDFAKEKEGNLPAVLPFHYLELLDFYGELERPALIDGRNLERYFALQEANLPVLAAAALAALYWGRHYELEIYKYAGTTKKGGLYQRTVRFTIYAMSFVILFLNEALDLAGSGLAGSPGLLHASVQSWAEFSRNQDNATILECLGVSFVGKAATIFLVCFCVELLARRKKNRKDTVIHVVCILLALFFISQALKSTPYVSLLQIGIVDWQEVIGGSLRALPLNLSTLQAGCLISVAAGIIIGIAGVCRGRRQKL